jgi:hypothetical protein
LKEEINKELNEAIRSEKRRLKKILKLKSKSELIDIIGDLCIEKANLIMYLQQLNSKVVENGESNE